MGGRWPNGFLAGLQIEWIESLCCVSEFNAGGNPGDLQAVAFCKVGPSLNSDLTANSSTGVTKRIKPSAIGFSGHKFVVSMRALL